VSAITDDLSQLLYRSYMALHNAARTNGITKMKSSRIALFAFAAIVGLGTLGSPAPASATDWSWLSNKNYVHCLQLFSTGNFQIPPNASPAQIAAKHEQGRLYCNKQYGY
jgi:hypothetical protein